MLPPLLDETATRRDRLLWALVAVLAVGLMAAFWLLCQMQVRKAEQRRAGEQGEQAAIENCMRTVPHATLYDCARRLERQQNVAVR